MKIDELELTNFKAFKSQTFPFKKITLLTGTNSAGKSTVLNAISSILQGDDSKPFPFYFYNYGENIHLGGFKDIVNENNVLDGFRVGIKFSDKNERIYAEGKYRYATNGQQILINNLKINTDTDSLEVKWEGTKEGYTSFRKYKNDEVSAKHASLTQAFMNSFNKFLDATVDTGQLRESPEEADLSDFLRKLHSNSSNWESINIDKPRDVLNGLEENPRNKLILENYINKFSKLKSSTTYIGPIRPYPSRHYFLQNHTEKVNSTGSNAHQLLIDWSKSEKPLFRKVVSDLQFLGLADNLTPQNIKDELVELNITPMGKKTKVNLSDVGFGLSQILPVLIANASSKKDDTLLINQPEVHLHPSGQAQLANYFNNEAKQKNFIIETHSEYLINRFRVLVASKKLKADDINIIYIENDGEKPIVHDISINAHGELINAPKSFFETYFIDTNELIFASLKEE